MTCLQPFEQRRFMTEDEALIEPRVDPSTHMVLALGPEPEDLDFVLWRRKAKRASRIEYQS